MVSFSQEFKYILIFFPMVDFTSKFLHFLSPIPLFFLMFFLFYLFSFLIIIVWTSIFSLLSTILQSFFFNFSFVLFSFPFIIRLISFFLLLLLMQVIYKDLSPTFSVGQCDWCHHLKCWDKQKCWSLGNNNSIIFYGYYAISNI